MLFTDQDIADYYNQTQVHYRRWWKLDRHLAVHYGMWYPGTRSFGEALENTNHALLRFSGLVRADMVLDAGCGVGGSSVFLANKLDARVKGLTLSDRQVTYARNQIARLQLEDRVEILKQNFVQSGLPAGSFDLVWAIESVTSVHEKRAFGAEVKRLLKPGGILVVADYYLTPGVRDKNGLMEKWRRTWSMAPIITADNFISSLQQSGLQLVEDQDVTLNIKPTSKRMYYASLAGALPSVLYNITHRTSRFARTHYLSGFYQYRALQQGLWTYRLMKFMAPDAHRSDQINDLNLQGNG